jgi:hypothetical protein
VGLVVTGLRDTSRYGYEAYGTPGDRDERDVEVRASSTAGPDSGGDRAQLPAAGAAEGNGAEEPAASERRGGAEDPSGRRAGSGRRLPA